MKTPRLSNLSYLTLFSACLSAGLLSSYVWAQQPGSTTPTHLIPTSASYNWRNVEINGTGFVSGIIFHPTERGLAYVRTDIGGAYRWNPSEKRWVPITDHLGGDDWNLAGVESIALDPNDANRVYVMTGTYVRSWATNGAILRSTDRGNTWARTDLPFQNGANEDGRGMGERLIVAPHDSKILYFGTRQNGLWKSEDYGAIWKQLKSFPALEKDDRIGISFLTFDAKGTLYAGVASKTANLYQSSDNGMTWQQVESAPQGFIPHHGVFASDGTFYLTYSNGPGPNGVTDGAVWKRSAAGLWTKITPNAGTGFGYAGLGVDAKNPNVLMVSSLDRWALGDDIFRSTDGGQSWKSIKAQSQRDSSAAPYLNWGKNYADLGHWIGDLEIDPFDSSHVLYTTGATIWGSNNANAVDMNQKSEWDVRASGIEEAAVTMLVSPPVGPHLVSGMRDVGGFIHEDLTVSPRAGMMDNPRLSHNEGIDFAAQKPEVLVRTGGSRGGYSLDSGQNWVLFPTVPPTKMDGGKIAVTADGAAWVWFLRGNNSFVSWDKGTTWRKISGLPDKFSLVSDRVTPDVFYAVDETAKQILVSTDAGASFTPRGVTVPQGFSRIFAAPHRGGDIWLAGITGLMHSVDGGKTWLKRPLVTKVIGLGFGKAAPQANYPALYTVATIGGIYGVFRSDDGGQNWLRINDDQHQWGYIGQSITGDPRVYGRVFVSSNGRGILWGEASTH